MNPELLLAAPAPPPPPDSPSGAFPLLIDPTTEEKRIMAMPISPEQAKHWLKNFNPHNRYVRAKAVIDMSRLIKDGMWKFNHAPIIFDWNRAMMDGQHRLVSCVRTDTPILSDVVFGLDPGLRSTYDTTPRTVVDMLAMGGRLPAHANQCAAVARMLETVRREGIRGLWDPKLYASKQAVEASIAQGRFPYLDRAAQVAARTRNVGCPSRITGFCWHKFAEKDKETADRFIELFLTGLRLSEESPVYHLRNRLINSKLQFKEIIALFFKAWNFFRNEQPCARLQWRTQLSNPEAFPEI